VATYGDDSTATGVLWRSGTAQRTADAKAQFSVGGDQCGTDYVLSFELAQFDSVQVDVGNVRHIAISKSPRSGYYWRVLQIDALDTSTILENLEFALIPAGGVPSTNGADPLSVTLVDAHRRLLNAIRIGPGSARGAASDLTSIQSLNGSFTSPIQLNPVIVSPGWCLLAFEVNTAVSANLHHLTLRVLYVEVPIGVGIPF